MSCDEARRADARTRGSGKRRVAAAIASPAAKAVGAAWIAFAFQAIRRLAARSDSDMIAHASDTSATGTAYIRIDGMKGPPSGCGAAASARYGWCRSSSVLLAKKRPHGGGHTRRTRTRECPVLASGSVIFRTAADMKPACGRAHRPPRDTRAGTLVVPVKKGAARYRRPNPNHHRRPTRRRRIHYCVTARRRESAGSYFRAMPSLRAATARPSRPASDRSPRRAGRPR